MHVTIENYQTAYYVPVKAILEEANMYDKNWDGEQNFASMIAHDPQSVLVAKVDEHIVGFLLLDFHGEYLRIVYRFAIKKEFRNHGIGSALLQHAEDIAKAKGARELSLFVDAENSDLQKYYAEKGFITSGKKFICMWKRI